MIDVKNLIKLSSNFLQKNSPYILTGLGTAGVVSTAVMSAKATAKSKDIVYFYERENSYEHPNMPGQMVPYDTSRKEKVKLCWTQYIPCIVSGGLSIACIIGAQSVNHKRYAALAGLYALSETAFSDYKDQVRDILQTKQLTDLESRVADKKLEEHPLSSEYIVMTEKGEHLCFDTFSARYFKTDIEYIRRVQNDINELILKSEYNFVDLNELYYRLNLEGIKYGEEMGWDVYNLLNFKFTSRLADDGTPCMVLDYELIPRFDA